MLPPRTQPDWPRPVSAPRVSSPRPPGLRRAKAEEQNLLPGRRDARNERRMKNECMRQWPGINSSPAQLPLPPHPFLRGSVCLGPESPGRHLSNCRRQAAFLSSANSLSTTPQGRRDCTCATTVQHPSFLLPPALGRSLRNESRASREHPTGRMLGQAVARAFSCLFHLRRIRLYGVYADEFGVPFSGRVDLGSTP